MTRSESKTTTRAKILAFLKLFVSRSHPSPTPQERRSQAQRLLDACAQRSAALRLVADAERRRDDREYGRALMVARQATADVLRMELGR